MKTQTVFLEIKDAITKIVPACDVLLFGSNARGDNNKHSDIDLLVITKNQFASKERINIAAEINRALVQQFHLPFDIVVRSNSEVEKMKNLPGHFVRQALQEGYLL